METLAMLECLDTAQQSPSGESPASVTWPRLRELALAEAANEPLLRPLLADVVLARADLGQALAVQFARDLSSADVSRAVLTELAAGVLSRAPALVHDAECDLAAVLERDAATASPLLPLLFFRGFRALQCHRIAHWLWRNERRTLALWLQSRTVDVHSIDIHPAARIGRGVMLDHGTGIVIGETAVIEHGVSILHGVTLGGTGSESRDRHPKVRHGVLIGAGATILGNIEIGEGARVAAGSVVVKPVGADSTVAGVPARAIERSRPAWASPALQTVAAS